MKIVRDRYGYGKGTKTVLTDKRVGIVMDDGSIFDIEEVRPGVIEVSSQGDSHDLVIEPRVNNVVWIHSRKPPES